MTIKEMDNDYLIRYYICTKRELKTIQSTIKQLEDELNVRFDRGDLKSKESEENAI